MSDRQDQILTAIDAALSGHTSTDPIGCDAMRWSPREDNEQTVEVDQPTGRTYTHVVYDEFRYFRAGDLAEALPVRPSDRFSFTRATSSHSVPARLSPAEAMIPGPNGPLHIRGAYGDQPMQVAAIELDDIEGDQE